jgi:NAD(P)-dependent dehydrogenase (short-subunit alcohol dehydrogenase family)
MSADYSSFGLTDKVAVVTGASQGIGKAIALGLARQARTSCSGSTRTGVTKKSTR